MYALFAHSPLPWIAHPLIVLSSRIASRDGLLLLLGVIILLLLLLLHVTAFAAAAHVAFGLCAIGCA